MHLPLPERIDLVDGEAKLLRRFFEPAEADRYLAALLEQTCWTQQQIRVRGRPVASPRLSAWHGDPHARYAYSGLSLDPLPWTPPLREIAARVASAAECRFNSVLLNLYRDGNDSMGWHSDDEPELGEQPTIASLSLGETRRFRLRHVTRRDLAPVSIELDHGSLLVMRGDTQRHWRHQVPKTRQVRRPRVNLTFRTIRSDGAASD